MNIFSSLTNRIFFASQLLLTVELPQLGKHMGALFRATGRFIWPLSYSLTLLPTAYVFQTWRPHAAAIVCILAAALQLAGAAPQIRAVRQSTAVPAPDLINQPQMTAWIEAHNRIWQFPSYPCGGLNLRKYDWGDAAFNREFQTQWLAARAGIPTNSIYSSRRHKDCIAEGLWGKTPRLEDGVLYIVSPPVVAASPELKEMANSRSCVTLDWAVAGPVEIDDPDDPASLLRVRAIVVTRVRIPVGLVFDVLQGLSQVMTDYERLYGDQEAR